ncbi:glycosyltransferase family 4 protein [Modestobacter marinus]|uniref:Glycosyl transferase family 1 n=1 Tax=Modestobacter marinus TaxID=477641 RepID=A0A846LK38_9ACTN|nr:glycosyltransferase family 4 protein [Modestobacter marinus]NIH67701.1 glycosyltransferase involved in cell wall biosynthesis [Modestobacter marinus]GGL72014.1 glycosyl transferase family 1 [Modestobacter marinus]
MPFVRGGAEQHQENLVQALTEAGHRVDLVRLPVAWEKGRLFDSPLAWRMVPIDADMVIATNFPSYFVQHPNKVVWLLHQHRGAYDGFAAGASWSDFALDDVSLEEQRLMTEWDVVALGEARRVFSNSGVVSDRLARFNGLPSTPLAHPPPLHDRLHPGTSGDYVLSVQRQEANKRPELLVDAMTEAPPGIRAVMAGRGELLDSLRDRVTQRGLQDRVALPGFVSDEELIDLYAHALAVVYVPEDEDYGYATLQAFYAGKPVICAADSGGVLDWVEDGVTGLVTDGTPSGVAAAVRRLAEDRPLAERLGAAGRERVAHLSWSDVVTRLTTS